MSYTIPTIRELMARVETARGALQDDARPDFGRSLWRRRRRATAYRLTA